MPFRTPRPARLDKPAASLSEKKVLVISFIGVPQLKTRIVR
jgi:hypothetical protein